MVTRKTLPMGEHHKWAVTRNLEIARGVQLLRRVRSAARPELMLCSKCHQPRSFHEGPKLTCPRLEGISERQRQARAHNASRMREARMEKFRQREERKRLLGEKG